MKHLCALLLLSACSGSVAPDGGADANAPWPVLPSCIDPAGGMPQPQDMLRGSNGAVSYRLWRCYVGQGAGFTAVFRGDAFELVAGGQTYRVDQPDITYTWTHHNWADSLVAEHPQATLRWRTEFQSSGELAYFVSATDRSGAVILPETRAD